MTSRPSTVFGTGLASLRRRRRGGSSSGGGGGKRSTMALMSSRFEVHGIAVWRLTAGVSYLWFAIICVYYSLSLYCAGMKGGSIYLNVFYATAIEAPVYASSSFVTDFFGFDAPSPLPRRQLLFAQHRERLLPPPRTCLLYTSPSPRDLSTSRMPSSA